MRTRTTPRQDGELSSEVELCTTLLIASTGTERRLTQAEVDQLLGVPETPGAPGTR